METLKIHIRLLARCLNLIFSFLGHPYYSTSSPHSRSSTNWVNLLYPDQTSNAAAGPGGQYQPETTTTPTRRVPPTLLPLPIPPKSPEVPDDNKGFNEKWNYDDESGNDSGTDLVHKKSMPGTMVLVIGIILGAFVAMVMIVIIVLKMRTRVDGTVKCEEAAPRYQFASPANDYGEIGEQETATTSLIDGGVGSAGGGGGGSGNVGVGMAAQASNALSAAAQQAANGFFNNGAVNGDRSRLFRKSNGSKPVREWYV